jgi:molybdate transport system substrate-binding protein
MRYSFVGSTGGAGEEPIMKAFSFVIFATLLLWPATASAQLNVLISGGFSGAYEQLLPEFDKAKIVAIPGSTSGIWLTTDLFPRLGIAEKMNVKVTPRGKDATGMVAAGDADLAVMPVSEIVHAPGVDFAGSVAPEIQFVQTFSAAVVAGSGDIEGFKRLIEFLASAHASEAIRNSGMEPLATSR